MGFLDEIGSLAGQLSQNSDHAKVMGGLMQALEEHPGGVQGLLQSFEQNGVGDQAKAMASGEQPTTTPDQVQQGLNGTGLIEKVAEKAGVSPEIVTVAMTAVLPMVLQHFAPNGEAAPHSEFSGLAQSLLSRLG